MADERVVLRSPFNGGTFEVPPEWSPDLVAELTRPDRAQHERFVRVEERKPKAKRADPVEE